MSATKEHYHDAIEAGQRAAQKELPILFSTPMVQAILDGQKSQTRRIIKDIHPDSVSMFKASYANHQIGFGWIEPNQFNIPEENQLISLIKCPYGHPGELLWVRETFKPVPGGYAFHADKHINWCKRIKKEKWKPSIHMPKEAARIWLEMEEIRVERLQDISEEDAIAEGISQVDDSPVLYNNYLFDVKTAMWPEYGSLTKTYGFTNPVDSFRSLFEKINGPASWLQNPWVWVVKFKVLSTNGKQASPCPTQGVEKEKSIIQNS